MATETTVAITTAERVAETLRLHAELSAVWPGQSVSVGVFYPSHDVIHEAAAVSGATLATNGPGGWTVSAGLANYGTNPKLFAHADLDCSTCRALIAESKAREQARGEAQP